MSELPPLPPRTSPPTRSSQTPPRPPPTPPTTPSGAPPASAHLPTTSCPVLGQVKQQKTFLVKNWFDNRKIYRSKMFELTIRLSSQREIWRLPRVRCIRGKLRVIIQQQHHQYHQSLSSSRTRRSTCQSCGKEFFLRPFDGWNWKSIPKSIMKSCRQI